MKKKVLILGVAAPQMDAILQLKKMGYQTHACAMEKDGPGADVADYFSKINLLDRDSIINYIKNNEISLVYSVGSDLAMPVVSFISEKLKLPHFVTEKTAKICNNKNLLRETLGNNFEGNVKFQVVSNINEKPQLKYPFIVKPADSQGQRGVEIVHNFDEYKKYFEKAQSYSRSNYVIIEQYISGPELSVNGYLVNGEIKFLIPSDRETWEKYLGLIHKHIVPSEVITLDIVENIKNVIEGACEKLDINNGPVYAQMKIENGQPYIIEITPRLDGCHMWKLLKYYSGVNLLKLTFEHLLNNDTSELENTKNKTNSKYTLEFICQEPNTKADYTKYEKKLMSSLKSFKYYNQGDLIRPVNNKYEKIGYFIYEH